MVSCPECNSQIDVEPEDLDEGELISCEECGAELRVLGLSPLELESVEEEDEEEGHADAEEGDDNEHWQ